MGESGFSDGACASRRAMAARKISPAVYAAMVVLVAAATTQLASAQGQQGLPFCVQDLNGCAPYLNSTTDVDVPDPEACCNTLKWVAQAGNTDKFDCLCALVKRTQLLQQLNINHTRVLGLPEKCGAGFSLAGCDANWSPPAPPPADAALPPSPPGTPSPPSSIASPPESQGPTGAPLTGNAWTGLPSLTTYFLSGALFWLSV